MLVMFENLLNNLQMTESFTDETEQKSYNSSIVDSYSYQLGSINYLREEVESRKDLITYPKLILLGELVVSNAQVIRTEEKAVFTKIYITRPNRKSDLHVNEYDLILGCFPLSATIYTRVKSQLPFEVKDYKYMASGLGEVVRVCSVLEELPDMSLWDVFHNREYTVPTSEKYL